MGRKSERVSEVSFGWCASPCHLGTCVAVCVCTCDCVHCSLSHLHFIPVLLSRLPGLLPAVAARSAHYSFACRRGLRPVFFSFPLNFSPPHLSLSSARVLSCLRTILCEPLQRYSLAAKLYPCIHFQFQAPPFPSRAAAGKSDQNVPALSLGQHNRLLTSLFLIVA